MARNPLRWWRCGVLFACLVIPAPLAAQAAGAPQASASRLAMGEQPVSPGVWATWFAEVRADDPVPRTLSLVILWRGSPDWYAKQTGGTARIGPSGGDSGQPAQQARTVATAVAEARYRFRDHEIGIRVEFKNRTAYLPGQTVRFGDHNVILVDDADGSGKVVGMLHIDPSLPPPGETAPPIRLGEALRRSPEIREFLR